MQLNPFRTTRRKESAAPLSGKSSLCEDKKFRLRNFLLADRNGSRKDINSAHVESFSGFQRFADAWSFTHVLGMRNIDTKFDKFWVCFKFGD